MCKVTERMIVYLLIVIGGMNPTAHGQKKEPFIIFPEVRTLYSGFDNLVRIYSENSKIKLECTGCDTVYKLPDKKNEWVVRGDQQRTITLIVKDKKEHILHEEKIQITPVPKPFVYLDGIGAQSVLSEIPSTIALKLDESIPLSVQFSIIQWQIKINEQEFKGAGKFISEEVKAYINKMKNGIIHLVITYYDPTGKYEMNEFFALKIERDPLSD